MKVFISHKQEDADIAMKIANALKIMGVEYYLDVLDYDVVSDGKGLTEHIKHNLNECTDIIVVMSQQTRSSQWVPFEVGMSAQKDMPTATYLQDNVELPEFLEYWPCLKRPGDVIEYVSTSREVSQEYRTLYESAVYRKSQTTRFYEVLKSRLR